VQRFFDEIYVEILRDSSAESKCRRFLEENLVEILRDSSAESKCKLGFLKIFDLF